MRISDWSSDVCSSDLTFFRPELGDEVIVGFLHDDPDHPVILGMLHSSALPAPLEATNSNPEKGYVSRAGTRMIFNDEDKSVVVKTPSGKSITLDENADTVSAADEHGNTITMRSEEHTSELQPLMRISYAGFCLKK